MASCALCGKTTTFGKRAAEVRPHHFKRSNRAFRPNLQSVTLNIDGNLKRVKACTRCVRTYNRVRQ